MVARIIEVVKRSSLGGTGVRMDIAGRSVPHFIPIRGGFAMPDPPKFTPWDRLTAYAWVPTGISLHTAQHWGPRP